MQIKGTAVKTAKLFVEQKFNAQYTEWLKAQPQESQELFTSILLASSWYPMKVGVFYPTQAIADLFYNKNFERASFDIGEFSAIYALKGVYKIFVKVASIDFVLKRVETIFETYYSGGKFNIVNKNKNGVEFLITGFEVGDEFIFPRIAGWIKGVFFTISKGTFNIDYKHSKVEDNKLECKILVNWEKNNL